MERANIVSDGWRRRLISIFTDEKMEALEYDEKGVEILKNPEITAISINDWHKYEKEFRILGGLRPYPGMLLILSPYNDYVYSEIKESRDRFAIEKMASTIALCQYLGAKTVKSKHIKLFDKETTKVYSLDLEAKSYKGMLNSKKHELNSLKNKLQLTAKFEGCESDIKSAKDYLKEHRLDTDIVLTRLLEMKEIQSKGQNKVFKLIQEISLTESLQNTFDFVATVNFPAGYINAEYKKMVQEKIEILLTLEIEF